MVTAYLHRLESELHDLWNDPHEAKSLADAPEHQKVLEELKSNFKAFQKSTKRPLARQVAV